MKTVILAAFAALSLGLSVANAAPAPNAAPASPTSGSQSNWMSVSAGWG
jgi:hypothetical protein